MKCEPVVRVQNAPVRGRRTAGIGVRVIYQNAATLFWQSVAFVCGNRVRDRFNLGLRSDTTICGTAATKFRAPNQMMETRRICMRNELTNGNIRITRYSIDDIPQLYEAAVESAEESFTLWMPWCHAGYSMSDAIEFVAARDALWEGGVEYDFVISDVATGKYLGGVGINQINRGRAFANLGYWVRKSEMGKGVAGEAVKLMMEFGFEDLGLKRVEIVVAVGNERSHRVAEKVGAEREGVLRKRRLVGERWEDAVMWGIAIPLAASA